MRRKKTALHKKKDILKSKDIKKKLRYLIKKFKNKDI